MIFDLENSEVSSEHECDIAIVGAGAVGITMAIWLARKGRDVLLLEAGGVSLELASQALYHGVSSTPLFDGLNKGRFRLLGGTTNFWGGQLATLDPLVFESRPWLPFSGWPLAREELDSYYDLARTLMAMKGCLDADVDVWRRLGTTEPTTGDDLEVFFTRWCPQPNFARLFQKELERDSLRVLVHANVTSLGIDAGTRSIGSIRIATLGGRTGKVRAKRVVLACGTIEICRLLQMQLYDAQTPPWHDNRWLGRVFLDHVDCTAGQVNVTDRENFHNIFDNVLLDGFKYHPKIKPTRKAQETAKILEVAGQFVFRSKYSDHIENLKLMIRALRQGRVPSELSRLPRHAITVSRTVVPLIYRYFKSRRVFNFTDEGVFLRLMSEQWPDFDSRISLLGKRDALNMPLVKVDWNVSPHQVDTLASFAELLKSWLLRSGLAKLEIDPLLLARDPKFLQTIDDGFHQMGGARMAYDAESGVVDTNQCVFGTNNLYVSGAAVFPVSGFANPTFTAIALGLRLADRLMASP